MELFELAMYKAMNGSSDGGGGITNPKLTVTVVNNTGSEVYIYDGFCSYTEDNMIYHISEDGNGIPANETKVFNILAIPYVFEGELSWVFDLVYLMSVVATNLVNCTYADGAATITDPTQDASLTLTFGG